MKLVLHSSKVTQRLQNYLAHGNLLFGFYASVSKYFTVRPKFDAVKMFLFAISETNAGLTLSIHSWKALSDQNMIFVVGRG